MKRKLIVLSRRLSRFSIRALLAFVACICVALAAWTSYREQAAVEKRTIARIAGKLKETVQFDPTDTIYPDGVNSIELFNANVRFMLEVDAGWASKLHSDSDALRVTEISISPDPFQVTPDDHIRILDLVIPELARFASLRSVEISSNDLLDRHIAGIKQCRGLKTLQFRSNKLTDDGLANVAEIAGLEELAIGSDLVTDVGLGRLSKLRNLSKLQIASTSVTDLGIGRLSELKNVSELDLHCPKMTGAGFSSFPRLLRLRTVTGLSSAGYEDLTKCKCLHNLDICGGNFADAQARCLAQMPSLQSLRLESVEITDSNLREICRSRQLRGLWFDHIGHAELHAGLLTVDGLAALRSLELERFCWHSYEIPEGTLDQLASLKTLKSLSIGRLEYNATDLQAVAKMTNLRECFITPTVVNQADSSWLKSKLPPNRSPRIDITFHKRPASLVHR